MKNHGMGGLITASIFQIVFLYYANPSFADKSPYAYFYLVGLAGYFIYVGFRKLKDGEKFWDTDDVVNGFVSPLLAFWAVLLIEGVRYVQFYPFWKH
jgi:hypothetical protein